VTCSPPTKAAGCTIVTLGEEVVPVFLSNELSVDCLACHGERAQPPKPITLLHPLYFSYDAHVELCGCSKIFRKQLFVRILHT
jgi:hypothetical protein